MVLRLSVFNDQPLVKTIALKLFNHDYTELKESFEKSFCCKCGEQPGAPGVCPKPSDQGLSESCTLHAISEAISFMDKKMSVVKQDGVETVLQCNGHQHSMRRK